MPAGGKVADKYARSTSSARVAPSPPCWYSWDRAAATRKRQAARFVGHYLEMCAAMCIGFAVGDLVYFWIAELLGYGDPFSELPVLSLAVVTFNMTAPMAAWMAVRGMPSPATAEMSAAMVVLAVGLLLLGAAGTLPMDQLALLAHGLMMPAMLVPMLRRRDLYTRHAHASSG